MLVSNTPSRTKKWTTHISDCPSDISPWVKEHHLQKALQNLTAGLPCHAKPYISIKSILAYRVVDGWATIYFNTYLKPYVALWLLRYSKECHSMHCQQHVAQVNWDNSYLLFHIGGMTFEVLPERIIREYLPVHLTTWNSLIMTPPNTHTHKESSSSQLLFLHSCIIISCQFPVSYSCTLTVRF